MIVLSWGTSFEAAILRNDQPARKTLADIVIGITKHFELQPLTAKAPSDWPAEPRRRTVMVSSFSPVMPNAA